MNKQIDERQIIHTKPHTYPLPSAATPNCFSSDIHLHVCLHGCVKMYVLEDRKKEKKGGRKEEMEGRREGGRKERRKKERKKTKEGRKIKT